MRIVSTRASSVGRPACELFPEAEDHEQRVVDRHAEPDERDEELHDDRDVGDVRQQIDAEERREDGGGRHRQRDTDGGQRPEHEEEHEERARSAEQGLGQDARSGVAALRLEDRIASRQVARHAVGRRSPECGPRLLDRRNARERRVSGRVDRRNHRVPVGREVHVALSSRTRSRRASPGRPPRSRRSRP